MDARITEAGARRFSRARMQRPLAADELGAARGLAVRVRVVFERERLAVEPLEELIPGDRPAAAVVERDRQPFATVSRFDEPRVPPMLLDPAPDLGVVSREPHGPPIVPRSATLLTMQAGLDDSI